MASSSGVCGAGESTGMGSWRTADRSWDACLVSDNYEHLPRELRHSLMGEMIRVTKGLILVGFPQENEIVSERLKSGRLSNCDSSRDSWVNEHVSHSGKVRNDRR